MRLPRPQIQLRPLPSTAGASGAAVEVATATASERLAAALLSTPFLAAVLVFLTWPLVSVVPALGPDPSWQAGLYMALEGGMQFGREVVFTYGPLGFLHSTELFGEGLWFLAFGYQAAIRVALTVTLLWVARRALPLPLALAACFVILVVGHLNSAVVLLAFAWAYVAISEQPPRFVRPLLVYGGGALAAIELLGKVNYGVSIFLLCGLALALAPGRRASLPRFGAVFVASFLGLWLLAGQDLANLHDYFANTLQVVSGYSRSMGVDFEAMAWEIPLSLGAAALVLAGIGFATRGTPWPRRLGAIALFLLFAFVCFKQDFIRRGIEGRMDFALMMSAAALVVGSRMPRRGGASTVRRWTFSAVLVAPALALMLWFLPTLSVWSNLAPGDHVSFLRQDLRTLVSSGERTQIRDQARTQLRRAYALPAAVRERLGDRTVAIEPWEISAAWAYDLNWQPLPVIQDYAAYTPALDRLNASALAGAGPEAILRQNTRGTAGAGEVRGVDDRYPGWDAPAAKLALLCGYAPAISAADWQLVERVPGRCGPARPLASLRTETGAEIDVPAAPGPGQIVFARIRGLDLSPAESLLAMAYRAPDRWVSFDAGGRWSMAGSTAADGLILSAPPAVDFPRPFQLAPNPRRFAVGVDGAGPRQIEVEFLTRRVAAAGPGELPQRP